MIRLILNNGPGIKHGFCPGFQQSVEQKGQDTSQEKPLLKVNRYIIVKTRKMNFRHPEHVGISGMHQSQSIRTKSSSDDDPGLSAGLTEKYQIVNGEFFSQ